MCDCSNSRWSLDTILPPLPLRKEQDAPGNCISLWRHSVSVVCLNRRLVRIYVNGIDETACDWLPVYGVLSSLKAPKRVCFYWLFKSAEVESNYCRKSSLFCRFRKFRWFRGLQLHRLVSPLLIQFWIFCLKQSSGFDLSCEEKNTAKGWNKEAKRFGDFFLFVGTFLLRSISMLYDAIPFTNRVWGPYCKLLALGP